MKSNLKSFAVGILAGSMGITTVFAAPISKAINAVYSISAVTVDGRSIQFAEDSKPFMVDGRTYLPVRAVAEALDKNVDYDSATATVKITSKGTSSNGGNTTASAPSQEIAVALPYKYVIANNSVTITKYTGNEESIIIPSTIEGCPVTVINASAFSEAYKAVAVTIPKSVTAIGTQAFSGCSKLIAAYFEGDAPKMGGDVFVTANKSVFTVYYHAGTTGWKDYWEYCTTATY